MGNRCFLPLALLIVVYLLFAQVMLGWYRVRELKYFMNRYTGLGIKVFRSFTGAHTYTREYKMASFPHFPKIPKSVLRLFAFLFLFSATVKKGNRFPPSLKKKVRFLPFWQIEGEGTFRIFSTARP